MTGCSSGSARTEVIVTGSTTILPIAEVAAEMYGDANPNVFVLASGGGSAAGIENVASGSSDIGTASRDLKDAEKELGLVDTVIAYDAIAVIVNPANPVRDLSTDEVRDIFAGKITNWRDVGGPDKQIGLVNRDEASGTREAFAKMVMGDVRFAKGAVILPGTGQVRSVVADIDYAIGYISAGLVDSSVKAVAIDGVAPSEASVIAGTYKIQRRLHALTRPDPSPEVQAFIDYVLSPAVQESVVRKAGFIPVSAEEGSDG